MDRKILVADDDDQIIQVVSRVLSGYRLITAKDGDSALALAVSERPDILLLDVAMPGLDGLGVLQKLAALPKRPLVIMITGDETIGTISTAMGMGVFSYITKPFEGEEILSQVKLAAAFLDKAE
ncbi:MAG: hypothetical protein A2049_00895 [Elusimicrobia bacterium GWA2_62_23]|nr:MAG: hypothetical protein A2049_00895 [Elusimicrobia bacterium GWA2_62_23]